ncbi:unnamed protein product [marine sediment metagenome]|uniref:Uncharacterized protein n=1 Tax=marine sediment metagenome TaxID=412755 RepID=X1Q321_9ZZZZ
MIKKNIKRKFKDFLREERGSIGKIQAMVLGLGSALVGGGISEVTEPLAELDKIPNPDQALAQYSEYYNYSDHSDYSEYYNYSDHSDYSEYYNYSDYSDYSEYYNYADTPPVVDDVWAT